MKDINRLFIEGRLTRDLGERDFRAIGDGSSALSFPIASNRAVKDGDGWRDEPSFLDVTVFGKQAEALRGWLCKGSHVFIEGSLRQERWQGKNGESRQAVRIIADTVKVERHLPPRGDTGKPREFEDDMIPF